MTLLADCTGFLSSLLPCKAFLWIVDGNNLVAKNTKSECLAVMSQTRSNDCDCFRYN